MRKCPSCGFNNPDTRDRCVRCSALLVSQALPDGSHVADAPPPAFQALKVQLNLLSYRIGRKLGGKLPTGMSYRYPWTAAYLGLIPGAGQLYNGQPIKAVIFILIYLAHLAVMVATLYHPWNNLVALVCVFWILYVLADGFVTAVRINGDPWRWRQVAAVWFALMFCLGVVLTAGQFLGSGVFQLVTMRQSTMAPAIMQGDKFFVLGWPFLRTNAKPGSFVYYDPKDYVITKQMAYSADTYTVNERNSFGVVTAMPGEVVSCTGDGVIRVDGAPVDAKRLPVNPNGVAPFGNVRIKVGEVGVIISHGSSDHAIGLSKLMSEYALDTPSPRDALKGGWGIQKYDLSVPTPMQDLHGVILFRYYPPERREWFGWDGGLWKTPPAEYPQPVDP